MKKSDIFNIGAKGAEMSGGGGLIFESEVTRTSGVLFERASFGHHIIYFLNSKRKRISFIYSLLFYKKYFIHSQTLIY